MQTPYHQVSALSPKDIGHLVETAVVANSHLHTRAYRAKNEGCENPSEHEVLGTLRSTVAAARTIPQSNVLRAELMLMHARQIAEWTGYAGTSSVAPAVAAVDEALAAVRATPAYLREKR